MFMELVNQFNFKVHHKPERKGQFLNENTNDDDNVTRICLTITKESRCFSFSTYIKWLINNSLGQILDWHKNKIKSIKAKQVLIVMFLDRKNRLEWGIFNSLSAVK